MSDITMTSDVTVKLIHADAKDEHVIQSAQVSVIGENNPDTDQPRLIRSLMKNRHGSPFEHNSMTFFVEAPIFVFREMHRHRHASINEASGRYSEMLPRFYTPAADRMMVNRGNSMRPDMVLGDQSHHNIVAMKFQLEAEAAWQAYREMLAAGVVKEVARGILPVNIMSQMYWTVNARSLMNFLSLRVHDETAQTVSYPQWEIQMVAEKLEYEFKKLMPDTHEAFSDFGRVAP